MNRRVGEWLSGRVVASERMVVRTGGGSREEAREVEEATGGWRKRWQVILINLNHS